MWSQILLCLSVGLAFASENPAWSEQKNYHYEIHGRSFAGLNQISSHYSGIVFRAKLDVQPRSDGNLAGKISDAKYAKVHNKLYDGWDTEIPDSELSFQPLSLSGKAFHMVMNNGVVRNVIVNKQATKNWEANMIKSIVSQLQLDTKATNLIPSSINILTQDESNTAVFKTMEETVTGVSETLYDIHSYPQYVLKSAPWVVPFKNLDGEHGEVIEIVKNKNFTHSPQAPSYHAGLEGIAGYKPGNKIGSFLSRTSVSQAVITGTLKKFTIQSAVTTEDIALSPTFAEEEAGSVHSRLNLTLSQVSKASDDGEYEVENPVEVGVVYGYDNPYGTDNSPRPAREYDHGIAPSSAESESRRKSSNSRRSGASAFDDLDEGEDWHQDKPQLSEAPPSPLLPFTTGQGGQSIKKKENIVEIVRKLSEEIGQEFPHPKEALRQQTAGKFVTLTSLIRIMDQTEMKQVAEQLHSSDSEKSPAWVAFRDAVAQAGTGPAISNIKEWIKKGLVSDYEAAEIIATAASAARQPTEEYMRFFNEMIKDDSFMSKPHLNESALLSYTTLVRQVYGNRQESRGKFPVYSYGTFATDRGQDFVKKDVIPHLTRKLNEAISNADTRKIHAYIRALGNIGRQEILEAFEPYLEGQKKASHFQRILMVVALHELTRSKPLVARSVLYKIYQNPTEEERVRVAAVYRLMSTRPSAAMLQRMAAYTNTDTSDYVNAAVKSSIESASRLQHPEHERFRVAAESAKALLTTEEYGSQYGEACLRSFAEEELDAAYKQYSHTFGGEDHAIPRGINYMLRSQLGGVEQHVMSFDAIVSSFEDLVNVFQQQTKEYQRQQKEKQAQNPENKPWSSEFLAKTLKLENEQREGLEGNFYLHAGDLQSIFSFDNQTLEALPRVAKELEEALRNGKKYSYSKMMNTEESSLAFPTVLGLPFLYTYDHPVLVKSELDLKVDAKPLVSDGQVLHKPDTVVADFEMNAAVSGRILSQFGIFTPFDSQRYSAGYSKQYQYVVPLEGGKLSLDVQKRQMKVQVRIPGGNQQNVRLGHYSSWPYTSQNDIYNPKPTLKIIRSEDPYKKNIVMGDKALGVGVYVQMTSDERIDLASVYERFSQGGDWMSAMLKPWSPSDNLKFVHVDVGIDSAKSSTEQITLHLGYQRDYQENDPNAKKPDPNEKVQDIPTFAEDREKRQKEFSAKLGSYSNDAEILVADATLEMSGKSKIKYSLTAGFSKSNVDPIGAFMALARKIEGSRPQTLAYVQAGAKEPNTNGLNLDDAMTLDPTSTISVQGLLRHEERLSRADAKIKLSKSQERIEYLKEQDDYKECQREMKQEGNTQLPACARATADANLLDEFSMEMTYNEMDAHIVNATYKAYSVLRHHLYPRVEEDIAAGAGNKNRLDVKALYSPDLEAMNVSIASEYGNAEIRNAPLGEWARKLLVPHPVFHTAARLEGEMLKEDAYRPTCVIDKSETNSFDNKTYASKLSSSWTVALQFVPRRPSSQPGKPDQSVPEQLRETVESYIVYTRAAQDGSSQKEVKIVLQMPSTQGKIASIDMKPSARKDKGPKVLVDNQEVKYTGRTSSDFYGGQIQIYALPNEEVKLEVRGAFYLIFNGQTVKITAVNSKFRDSSRGLCGTFTGEPETDFLTPENCIIHKPEKFIESYTVDDQGQPKSKDSQRKCYQKKTVKADYISNQDAGRSSDGPRGGDDCTGYLSRYEETAGKICFTIRALPFCKSNCTPQQRNLKQIEVHCMDPTASTAFWRSQLDKGINVDFTLMEQTGTLPMTVPARCVP